MSLKSLLQLILLILIILIISAIYFVYFYSGPIKNHSFFSKTFNKIYKVKIDEEVISEQELLEDIIITKQENTNQNNDKIEEIKILENKKIDQEKNKNLTKKNIEKKNNPEKIKNLTKEIEYITSNKEGDIFKILAKYGQTNIDNTNILDLNEVDGLISSIKRSKIYIKSDYAKYDYNNQNSQFYSNVEIKYDDKIITCDNLDLQITENYAIAYNNVKIQDSVSLLKAQMVTLNIITKDIIINSQNKVEIISN